MNTVQRGDQVFYKHANQNRDYVGWIQTHTPDGKYATIAFFDDYPCTLHSAQGVEHDPTGQAPGTFHYRDEPAQEASAHQYIAPDDGPPWPVVPAPDPAHDPAHTPEEHKQ